MRFTVIVAVGFFISACGGGAGTSSLSPIETSAGSSSSSSSSGSSSSSSSGAGTGSATVATSVSYYDDLIVFQFAHAYEVGQFANGDYWVHNNGNDVLISAITPASTNTNEGRTINGTMVNPAISSDQGYDSSPRDMRYVAELNRDPGILGQPLVVQANSSVIKAISMVSDAGRPIISDAAVLTVLSEAPAAGSFRPPYTGVNKTIPANISDLDYSKLGTHPKPGGEPALAELEQSQQRVWLEHCTQWVQRDIHPLNNMPTYGRDMANTTAHAALALQLDYSPQEKEKLLVQMVQYGLDLYNIVQTPARWDANGGHNRGRKLPILLAGRVLNNNHILAFADAGQHFIFHDDQQSFYVSQAEVDMTHSAQWAPDNRAEPIPYTESDIGMPEWGIRHADKPAADNRNWAATYRINNGFPQVRHALAARLMGAEQQWNWPATFDYSDRFFEIERAKFEDYVIALWDAHSGASE